MVRVRGGIFRVLFGGGSGALRNLTVFRARPSLACVFQRLAVVGVPGVDLRAFFLLSHSLSHKWPFAPVGRQRYIFGTWKVWRHAVLLKALALLSLCLFVSSFLVLPAFCYHASLENQLQNVSQFFLPCTGPFLQQPLCTLSLVNRFPRTSGK